MGIEETLSQPGVHDGWEKNYRNQANEIFFELAFDRIAEIIGKNPNARILDAGCGSARHSVRLAKRGFKVTGVDRAEYVLKKARNWIAENAVSDKVSVQQEDLLNFSFENKAFDHVLCWGVLMHIPEIEKAISELCRVLKPGGLVILSEVSCRSVEVQSLELLRPVFRRNKIKTKRTPKGLEKWAETNDGPLLSRCVDVNWLYGEFARHGVVKVDRMAGQFSEMYARFESEFAQKLIHGFNNFWFRHIRLPGPACGNIIVLQKKL